MSRFQLSNTSIRPTNDFQNEVRRYDREHGSAIAINVDGACSNNGSANARGSYGVYFGQDSKFNRKGRLPDTSRQTNQVAELYAACAALVVLLCMAHKDEGYDVGGFGSAIISTDSAYIVNGITDWIREWERNGWRTSTGQPVENQQMWRDLHVMMKEMQQKGFEVQFMHVNRELNGVADSLARSELY